MAKDLRDFLATLEAEAPDDLLRVAKPVVPQEFDCTAILEKLDRRGRRPLVVFESPTDVAGRPSPVPVVMNVFATRERCARALGADPARPGMELALEFARLGRHPLPPVTVPPGAAPAQEVVHTGQDVDTSRLPIVTHSEGDYGPCLTMTLIVRDPESGAYNVAFIKAFYDFDSPRRLRITIHSPDSLRALKHYEDRGLPMPIVAVLGHHPAFYLGSMGLTSYQNDDYATIGAYLGEPLRLVPSRTWGEEFVVPADAEILIEGTVPPGVREICDPFGDITRQYQAQTLRPVMDVTAITHREEPLLQDVFAGHRDHMTVGQIPKEGSLFNTLTDRFGSMVKAVHLPYSGCGRLACYVAVEKSKEGQGKAVALAALQESFTFQTVVVVDAAIDVFDEEDVLWAVMVYTDPSRDVDLVHNMPTLFTTAMGTRKVLIDATRPLDRAMPEQNRIPAEALNRVRLEDYIEE
ncbi:UbiD family decarboxylase [Streptomyces sp. DSM 44917]|uniref:UbiD family decarboxylase n=1 Tax=Streptomyces boetiae TaxID=3075541 RepID=A0ABU2L4W6_9ACTN|nr:UbiD family decarboxylase [Streptomyces sp. DSM 44917]MDT0306461.1 UbiD family decarboxylase [Streptomyces sp. DSM 44917]